MTAQTVQDSGIEGLNLALARNRLPNDGLLIREMDGDLLALDPELDRGHQINESSSLIWRLHWSGSDANEITNTLGGDQPLELGRRQMTADMESCAIVVDDVFKFGRDERSVEDARREQLG